MKVKMRYKLHGSVLFLCIFVIILHAPMTTHGLRSHRSHNMIDDDPRYDVQPNPPFNKKRSAFTCDSCGNECTNACGTKNFRTCCFNYLRKRNDPNVMKSISNQHLIDFILLQGRAAMYTLAEQNRSNGDEGDESDDDDGTTVFGRFEDGPKLTPARDEGRMHRQNSHHSII